MSLTEWLTDWLSLSLTDRRHCICWILEISAKRRPRNWPLKFWPVFKICQSHWGQKFSNDNNFFVYGGIFLNFKTSNRPLTRLLYPYSCGAPPLTSDDSGSVPKFAIPAPQLSALRLQLGRGYDSGILQGSIYGVSVECWKLRPNGGPGIGLWNFNQFLRFANLIVDKSFKMTITFLSI
jgi:hypothetical protein